jgi:RHS repeat-associated protein
MLTMQRYGLTAAATYGIIDNLTMTYNGNQMKTVSDAAADIALNTSMDFKDYSNIATEYTYNKNGAMSQDLNKGISAITYNSLNLPRMVDIKNKTTEGRNEYTYSASGQKLKAMQKWNPNYSTTPVIGSTINTAALTQSQTTDYVGNIIYEDNALKRILVDGGYYESGNYYFYITDHLGNNRIVTNAAASVVQSTQYYPFGSSFADASSTSTQPYKYNGKELDARNGLNMYDYSARWKPDWYFTTVDPLAEKYYSISPYVYCGNNPIIRTDPTGMIWEDEEEAKKLKRNIQDRQASLNQTIGNNLSKMFEGGLSEKELNKLVAETSDALASIKNLGQAIDDINRLGFDQENVYAFNNISGGQHNVRKDGSDGKIYIETSSDAISIHEITHVRQSLTSSGGLRFDPDGRLYNAGGSERGQAMMEVESYRMQYSYDKSFPGNTKGKGLNGIDIHSVGNIRDNGIPVYPNIYNYSNKLNKFIKEQNKLYNIK